MKPKIKICGLKHPENIREVLTLGADYIGFIFYPPSQRFVGQLDAEWVAGLHGVTKTGVFVNADINHVRAMTGKYAFQALQLHGNESPGYCAELKDGNLEIIKAFGVDAHFDWAKLGEYEDVVDYYLFDTQSTQHGGTGMCFDWKLLDGYSSNKPFFLSGGISAENIADALRLMDTRLYALDLNSRFETTPGFKDIALLRRTIQTINDE